MFTIEFSSGVAEDLEALRTYDRNRLLDRIEEQLAHQPTQETRNKKPIPGLKPPWEYQEPIWQLRVDEYRVFYDVDGPANQVLVRAIRHKPAHKTTEEIL